MKTIINILMSMLFTVSGWAQLQNTAVTTDSKSQAEMNIAVSPSDGNKLLGAWADANSVSPFPVHVGWMYSTDGGVSWGPSTYSPLTPFISGTSYNYVADCSVSFDNNGNVFIVFIAASDYSHRGSATVAIAQSSWPPTSSSWTYRFVDSFTGDDKPYLAVDNTGGSGDGHLYVTWAKFSSTSSDIYYAASTNHGSSFSTPLIAHDNQ